MLMSAQPLSFVAIDLLRYLCQDPALAAAFVREGGIDVLSSAFRTNDIDTTRRGLRLLVELSGEGDVPPTVSELAFRQICRKRVLGTMALLAGLAAELARAQSGAEAAEAAETAGAKDASQEKDADGERVVLEGKEVVRCDMQYCQRPVDSAPRICNIHTVCFVCIQVAMRDAAAHQWAKAKCPGCTRLFNTRDVRMHMRMRDQGGSSGTQ
jgi:hypothetical protein